MVAIKDMTEMPKNCWDCPILCEENGQCKRTKKYIYGNDIPADCPLVEIVTCKDCEHNRNGVCPSYRHFVDDNFYCANGEKKWVIFV